MGCPDFALSSYTRAKIWSAVPSSMEAGCRGFKDSSGLLVTSARSSCNLAGPASPRLRLIVNALGSLSPFKSEVRDERCLHGRP